jgi:DNA processing protein
MPSAAGLAFTERLARGLGEAGYAVASGLARGIDTRAHKASLTSGTVAVLAGGQDRIYPADNEPLLHAILESGGAILSEMPVGWEPRGRDFPRRNRIVSGLSYGVVVVEAARRSGSLITARFALEQGREVFAVPGSPLDPRAEGTNDLIREGATLCASPEHVTGVLDPLVTAGPRRMRARRSRSDSGSPRSFGTKLSLPGVTSAPLEPIRLPFDDHEGADPDAPVGEAALIDLLGPSPVSVDELVRQSGLTARLVHMQLLELEIAGRLERHGGNVVSLIARR